MLWVSSAPELALARDHDAMSAVPRHIAIVMTATPPLVRASAICRDRGHRAGVDTIRKNTASVARERGVETSRSTRSRPRLVARSGGSDGLMGCSRRRSSRETEALVRDDVGSRSSAGCTSFPRGCSARSRAPSRRRRSAARRHDARVNYGGRAEIVDAVRRLVADCVTRCVDDAAMRQGSYAPDHPDPIC